MTLGGGKQAWGRQKTPEAGNPILEEKKEGLEEV